MHSVKQKRGRKNRPHTYTHTRARGIFCQLFQFCRKHIPQSFFCRKSKVEFSNSSYVPFCDSVQLLLVIRLNISHMLSNSVFKLAFRLANICNITIGTFDFVNNTRVFKLLSLIFSLDNDTLIENREDAMRTRWLSRKRSKCSLTANEHWGRYTRQTGFYDHYFFFIKKNNNHNNRIGCLVPPMFVRCTRTPTSLVGCAHIPDPQFSMSVLSSLFVNFW